MTLKEFNVKEKRRDKRIEEHIRRKSRFGKKGLKGYERGYRKEINEDGKIRKIKWLEEDALPDVACGTGVRTVSPRL